MLFTSRLSIICEELSKRSHINNERDRKNDTFYNQSKSSQIEEEKNDIKELHTVLIQPDTHARFIEKQKQQQQQQNKNDIDYRILIQDVPEYQPMTLSSHGR